MEIVPKRPAEMTPARLVVCTLLALIAFAANSLLCRFALKEKTVDPATFTWVRIFAGALTLWLIARTRKVSWREEGNWPSALALFCYAATFSFAYVTLSAGTGALLLFGAVQATMIGWSLRNGEQLSVAKVAGFVVAVAGLVALVLPGVSTPPLQGSLLMLIAGAAWGVYSLRGKALGGDPISATTGNFMRAAPLAALLGIAFFPWARLDAGGLGFAVLSGALASGLGYVLWYSALPMLKAATAATIQLGVPVLAATAGILLLGEPLTIQFVMASLAILGGIALVTSNHAGQGSTNGER